jgi:hypothetical protein
LPVEKILPGFMIIMSVGILAKNAPDPGGLSFSKPFPSFSS